MSPAISQCRPLRIVVLAGGVSAEREVSLESGACVAAALKQRGHRVLRFDPAILALHEIPRSTDVIIPMLHGTGGEDGTLQRGLERLGIPWLGSSAQASELTFDKVATREALSNAGLPVAPGLALPRNASRELIKNASRQIGYPQVVKPAAQGSSVGISIVDSEREIDAAANEAARWGEMFLIEKYIEGREVTVPVINGEVFPVVEILPSARWYDYSAKYTDETTRYDIAPKNLPANLTDIVMAACKICGVAGISRTDLRIDSDGHAWILEINTIPGMTSHSLVPMSVRSRGISIGELCEQLLLQAIDRSQLLQMPVTNAARSKNGAR
jgi:D-alanine-D-alanine ligase